MQIAAAATQFNAYPYREADKKFGLKISPHIEHSSPASKTPVSAKKKKLQLLLIFKQK